MSEYLEIDISLIRPQEDELEILLALLADYGFEGFVEEKGRIIGYIPSPEYVQENFENFLFSAGFIDKIKDFKTRVIPDRNWNAIWEKQYSPVRISDKCLVRAPFHQAIENIEHDLVISPKMSFGTAHHETTRLMLEFILDRNWTGQKLLDFGCGTGVLAILAEKMGAAHLLALDNDPWAYRNARENIELNKCGKVEVLLGGLDALKYQTFDAIFGNVNLNVLVSEMENLSQMLVRNGIAILSGFYESDLQSLNKRAGDYGLFPMEKQSVNKWTVAVYRKGD